jgi:hypothetical protein
MIFQGRQSETPECVLRSYSTGTPLVLHRTPPVLHSYSGVLESHLFSFGLKKDSLREQKQMNEQRIERAKHKIYILNFRPLVETIICFVVSIWEGVITEKMEADVIVLHCNRRIEIAIIVALTQYKS